jgi:hypothetical protein
LGRWRSWEGGGVGKVEELGRWRSWEGGGVGKVEEFEITKK